MDDRQSRSSFAEIEQMVRGGLDWLFPGAVLVVAQEGRLLAAEAYGDAQRLATAADGTPHALDQARPMAIDTVFDVASVTKVVATTASLMTLVDAGRLALDDRLGTLLPAFAGTDKAPITVRQLLAHRAGLWEWQPTWLHQAPSGGALPYLAALPLRYAVGERRAYSDLGFMLLGEIVAAIAGMPLDQYARRYVHAPLGMGETGFRPAADRWVRTAATSLGDRYQRTMAETGLPYPAGPIPPRSDAAPVYRDRLLIGEANDANVALAWDGVAGHAGLFSTAPDLLRLAQALLDRDPRLASPATYAAFEQRPFDREQALGWRAYEVPGIAEPFFGHSGFTGTFLAYHRSLSLAVVLLTNRLHRDDRDGSPPPAMGDMHEQVLRDLAAAALGERTGLRDSGATTGDSA